MPFFTVRGPVALPSGVSYTGPGDIIASAIAWWGIRAYSLATIGTACCRIKRADTVEKDIVTAANGIIDVSDSHFNGSTPYEIVKFYDQSGNSKTIDTIVTTYPVLTLNDNGSLPCITCAAQPLESTLNTPDQAQPYCASSVVRNAAFAGATTIIEAGDQPAQLGFSGTTDNSVRMFVGSNAEVAGATSGVTHSVQGLFNGGSSASKLCVNGTSTGVSVGTNSLGVFIFRFPGNLTGKSWEGGWWPSDISSFFAAISTNQHSVWNF